MHAIGIENITAERGDEIRLCIISNLERVEEAYSVMVFLPIFSIWQTPGLM